jgi:hypothetical protein
MMDHRRYETIATLCQKTGRPCPAAATAAEQLARAAALACAAVPDFGMSSQLRLEGCAQGCAAQFNLDGARIELFCGVDADVDIGALCAFADSFLGTGKPLYGIGKLNEPPRAILRKYIGAAMPAEAAPLTVTG